MVGNDVVDLLDRESDAATLHPRFDERVFDPAERDALAASAAPATLRWQLWAAKEAAFKAAKKVRPALGFSPLRFVVSPEDAASGEVVVRWAPRTERVLERGGDASDGLVSDVSIEQVDGAVHAVARLRSAACGHSPRVVHEVLRVAPSEEPAETQSQIVRAFSCRRLATVLGIDPGELEIRKRARIPELWLRGAPAKLDLSLSHHGAVVAFACEVPAA